MTWDEQTPTIGRSSRAGWRRRSARARAAQRADDSATRRRRLAAGVLEEAFLHLVRDGAPAHRLEEALPGGRRRAELRGERADPPETPFEGVYIQPAAGDDGTAVGAALYVWNQELGRPRGS